MKNKILFWLMCALNVGCIFMITLLTEDVTHIATWITSTLSAIMAVGFAVLHAFFRKRLKNRGCRAEQYPSTR